MDRDEKSMVPSGETQRLSALDRRLAEIATWLNPSRLLNPTLSSRRAAIAGLRRAINGARLDDPVLEYLPLPQEVLTASHRALDGLVFGDTEVDRLLGEQARSMRLQLQLIEARGTPHFSELARRIYGWPDPELSARARALIVADSGPTRAVSSHEEGIDAETMASEMLAAMRRIGVVDWRVVVVEEMSARMSVSARHREVRVKSDSTFSREDRDRLIVHEIGTHVRRACRGFATGLLTLGLGLPGYIATEEGLASHLEEQHGLLRSGHIRMYALRAFGVHLALEAGFADTYYALIGLGASAAVSWDVAMRVKRGLTDTSARGCFPKDFAYLHGREIVSEYLASGGTLEELFVGKVGIQHLSQVRGILERWSFGAVGGPGVTEVQP